MYMVCVCKRCWFVCDCSLYMMMGLCAYLFGLSVIRSNDVWLCCARVFRFSADSFV